MGFSGSYQISPPPTVHFQQRPFDLERITQHLPDTDDLEVAFSRIRQEVPAGAQIIFRIVREGQPRGLNPVIWREAYRIGREALLNAFRHSEASLVEIELEYAPTRLRIAVRDDGKALCLNCSAPGAVVTGASPECGSSLNEWARNSSC